MAPPKPVHFLSRLLQREVLWLALTAGAVGLVLGLTLASVNSIAFPDPRPSPSVPVDPDCQGAAPALVSSRMEAGANDKAHEELPCTASGWRHYGDHYGPCNLCGLTPDSVQGALGEGHNCQKDAFWAGQWRPILSIRGLPREDTPVCILFCAGFIPCLHPPCLLSMHVRPGTSDALVVRDTFFLGAFRLRHTPMPNTLPLGSAVLDAGGNIGAAAVYFSLLYPNSTVVSLEPSGTNFQILQLNTRALPRVVPLHLALWSCVDTLCLVPGHRDVKVLPEYAFQVTPCSKAESPKKIISKLQGVPVWLLLEMFHLQGFDVMKIDIEGGEGEVFREGAEKGFLQKGSLAILELHDDMWGGATGIVASAFAKVKRWRDAGVEGEHRIWVADKK